jgi:hypothetical protein
MLQIGRWALPAIPAAPTGGHLAPAEPESDQPEEEHNRRHYPQPVKCETDASKNQGKKKNR